MNADHQRLHDVLSTHRASVAMSIAHFHALDLALNEGASWQQVSAVMHSTVKEVQDWYFGHLRYRDEPGSSTAR